MIYLLVGFLALWLVAVVASNIGDHFSRDDWREHNSERFDNWMKSHVDKFNSFCKNAFERLK